MPTKQQDDDTLIGILITIGSATLLISLLFFRH
jgi:hypothetical protein